jgi:signal transduction histidine kinase/DNA-binding response OmpR family regulator
MDLIYLMNIRTKIIAANLVISLFVIMTGLVGVYSSLHLDKHYKMLTDSVIPSQRAVQQLQYAGLRVVSSTSEAGFINAEMRLLNADDAKEFEEQVENELLEVTHDLLESALADYQLVARKDAESQKQMIDIYLASWQLLSVGDELMLRIREGDRGIALLELKEEFEIAEEQFLNITDAILARQMVDSDDQSELVIAELEETIFLATLMSVLAVFVAVLFGYLLSRNLLNPLSKLHTATEELGQGRLDVKLPENSKDEYGEVFSVFNAMVRRIHSLTKNLRSEKEFAEKANSAKSQFLATMSHEIRTPMNGVLGTLNMLKKTPLDDMQLRLVHTASGSGHLLMTVINDILDFSKIEAGKLELESILFDPICLVEETALLLGESAADKGLELICDIGEDIPRNVKGDPTRLKQILTNLIGNSIKFTEDGEVVLYLRLGEGDNCLEFGVNDTGIGMTAEQQKSIFSAFSQADNSITRKYGGTGLGLAITRQLLKKMGSELQLESVPGKGSSFKFCLHPDFCSDGEGSVFPSEMLTRQRILVVDDNENSASVLYAVLQSWGIKEVEIANSGDDALHQLRAAVMAGHAFDVVLLDMYMPSMSGESLAKAIRADVGLQSMGLILLGSVEKAMEPSLVDDLLQKPVPRSVLFNSLQRFLGEQVADTEFANDGQDESRTFLNQRLLLVEDVEINQMVAEDVLSSMGLTIDIVENGLEALNAVQKTDYAVVLMDVQMPVMDGLEATRRIRGLGGRYADLPIVAMTAHALEGDSNKSLASGMNGHITKPIVYENVFSVLSTWLTPAK